MPTWDVSPSAAWLPQDAGLFPRVPLLLTRGNHDAPSAAVPFAVGLSASGCPLVGEDIREKMWVRIRVFTSELNWGSQQIASADRGPS